ncbi:MAG: excalibur calcium-binding domain-containing protein [Caldilineaceae bacterium]|nr:excalibur calcium-binding domain-containing protein [Caldilineaceae bacterium]
MKRKTAIIIAAAFVIALLLTAPRLHAQGTLTLEDLANRINRLFTAQDDLTQRLAALEAASATQNWLAGIPIQPENRCTPYNSDDYRYPQSLEAQIVAETGGAFYSPYTGETFNWGEDVDIEHIVARSEAHDSGLCAADIFTRLAFASDPLNLTFASPQLNRDQKIAKDVAEWLPDLNQCWFVNRVVAVKRRYGLSMDPREAQAALAVLTACPSFAMQITAPSEESPASAETTTQPTETNRNATPQAEGHPLDLYDDNNNGRITCAEARRHNIAPVRSDHPAYPFMRDPDGDGIVCE